MRITVGSSAYNSLSNIELAQSQLAKLQEQLSSGNQITTPSDDPSGTVNALRTRSELARNAQYATNSADAIGWLSTADGTYSQSVATLQQARTLVVEALNTGANDATSKNAIAQQLSGLRTALLSLANTTYNGRPLFGGTTAEGTAFAADGTYQGDSGAVTRAVGAGNVVTVSAVGTDVFGSGGASVFTLLQNLSAAVSSGGPAATLDSALSDIDSAISRISTAQSTEGAAYQQVQRAQTVGTTEATALKTRLSGIEDVDLADLAVKVTTANTTYQAALQTTASIGQLSLLDFLR
jgi:flagellar hook-associated protein 3 FlgL